MRNNSQKAGCMRRFPASHSCQPRSVQWIRAAAAVCESPAVSRAARTCSGEGFAEGLFSPRFGCDGILGLDNAHANRQRYSVGFTAVGDVAAQGVGSHLRLVHGVTLTGAFADDEKLSAVGITLAGSPSGCGIDGGDGFDSCCHFRLQPLIPRRGGLRCATHELNYTRIACNFKSFLQKISEAMRAPHNVGDNPPQPRR